jgi:SAM-dependent methyltransferase
MPRIDRTEGRQLFGADTAAYDLGRPGQPRPACTRCWSSGAASGPGTSVLEVGAGTGQATRRLLELGADPIVVVEPNPSLAEHLEELYGDRLELVRASLEEADLEPTRFDLAAAASSFHWVDEQVGLARLFTVLRTGGWCAIWWTLFGEGGPPDPFIVATSPLLDGLDTSPTKGEEGRPRHALDRERRVAALVAAGFVDVGHELARWEAQWDSEGIRALYGSFSPILRLDEADRERILDEIARIASDEFGGRVTRVLTTSLYTARKPP